MGNNSTRKGCVRASIIINLSALVCYISYVRWHCSHSNLSRRDRKKDEREQKMLTQLVDDDGKHSTVKRSRAERIDLL